MPFPTEYYRDLNLLTGGSRSLPIPAGSAKTLLPTESGRTVLLDTVGGSTCTLPAATGSGTRYAFVVSAVPSGGSHVVKVANGSDIIQGLILGMTDNSAAVVGYRSADTSDTVTLDGTTMGGAERGDWFEVEDIGANLWSVRGSVSQSGSEASPFSATVS